MATRGIPGLISAESVGTDDDGERVFQRAPCHVLSLTTRRGGEGCRCPWNNAIARRLLGKTDVRPDRWPDAVYHVYRETHSNRKAESLLVVPALIMHVPLPFP
jgi:hypothetical protein